MMQPLYDKIIVRADVISDEPKSKGGLWLPAQRESDVLTGVVIAVGTGRINSMGDLKPLCVKLGDRIAFNKFAITLVTVGEDDFLSLRETDVFAIVGHEEVIVAEAGVN